MRLLQCQRAGEAGPQDRGKAIPRRLWGLMESVTAQQSRPQGLEWAFERVKCSNLGSQLQFGTPLARAASCEIQSEEDGPLSSTGFNPLFIVTKTPLYLFSLPLSISSWGMNILVCYLLCHLHSFFICSNLFFQVSKGTLYPNIQEKGVWQGPALQTQPHVEVSQAARACVYCPHFPIWKGYEQQSTGWFQDSVKCWL